MTKLCIKILVKSDSAIESAFPLHCGQYHIRTGRETMPCWYVFLHSHRRRLSVCKEDDNAGARGLPVTSYLRLLIPAFQIGGEAATFLIPQS